MTDPTREQAIEACKLAQRYREHRVMQPKMNEAHVHAGEQVRRFKAAATLLTRDGKLRERLPAIIAELRELCWACLRYEVAKCPSCQKDHEHANELEAALKEDEK